MALLDKLYLCVKYNELQIDITPLLLDKSVRSGFGRTESARRVPGRTARKNWVGERRIKSTSYIPPHPSLLPQGRRSKHLCKYYS